MPTTYAIPNGRTVFDAVLWTGDGTSPRTFNSWGFKPDLMWMKNRTSATDHALIDTVRGTGAKVLESNRTDAENDYGLSVSAFTANGFTGATGTFNFGYANTSANNYVGWGWQAGQGTNLTNTTGTITSTVSVNATAGFSIVTYTGGGVAGTIGHGLSTAPQFIIVKSRVAAAGGGGFWYVYNSVLGNTQYLLLNLANATATSSAVWNNTSPTSSVFSVGSSVDLSGSGGTYVAYCWAPVAGFSQFGGYTGNGSADGPFIYTGFRPKFVLFKNTTNGTRFWDILDSTRNPSNVANARLFPNDTSTEQTSTTPCDFLSNGFKIRTADPSENTNGDFYIYACFAENPLKFANAQ
jgi:hypothetical protein